MGTVVELGLCWFMVAMAGGATAFAAARFGRATVLMLSGELVMLAAMLDVCILPSQRMSAWGWGAVLLVVSLGAAATGRMRRGAAEAASGLHDAGHPLAMIIGAGVLVVLGGGGATGGSSAAAHSHGGSAADAVVTLLLLAALVHAVAAAWGVRELTGRGSRREGVRRVLASAALLAMAAMPFVS